MRRNIPLGPVIDERFEWSKTVTEAQCAAATANQERSTKHLADVLGTDGVLVMPTTADIAPLIGESGERVDSFRNRSIHMLRLAGLSGFPQVSFGSAPGRAAGAVPAGPARQRHGHDLAGPQWIAGQR